MITGGHSIIYSKDAAADRAFLRDILKMPNVDVGQGWLIFGLPPAEIAVHPGANGAHEFFFMVGDVNAFVAAMKKHSIACDAIADRGYGLVTQVTLPGGGKLGVYQPRHARPKAMKAAAPLRGSSKGKRAGSAGPKQKERRVLSKR